MTIDEMKDAIMKYYGVGKRLHILHKRKPNYKYNVFDVTLRKVDGVWETWVKYCSVPSLEREPTYYDKVTFERKIENFGSFSLAPDCKE